MVSPNQADYLIAVVLDVADKKQQDLQYHYHCNPMLYGEPLTPQTSQQIATLSYEQPILSPDHEITYHFIKRYIRLYLYTNPKTHAGNLQVVWQGNIEMKPSGPAASEKVLLKTLLNYFGKDHSGRVNPAP